MDRSKRAGAIAMAASIIMAFAFLVISDGWLAQRDLLRTIMGVLSICLSKGTNPEHWWNTEECLTELPTRYPLLICLIAFSIGLLLYRGVIHLPMRSGDYNNKNRE